MNNILIDIKNIKKQYGTREALKGISLTIYKGEVVSLLGVNGAGKTTLSSIIATLKPPTAGDVEFEGKSIYNNLIEYRKALGFCPQRPNLNPMLTLEDNLRFAGRYYDMTEDAITDRINTLVKQFELETYLSSSASVLSGGYKQRFLIARSLMHNPKLVILDEPTVALDPHVRHELWQYIRSLRDLGISVLLTTHYLDEAEFLSDRVCVLDHGEVRLVDTPANLMTAFQKSRLEDVFLQLMKEDKPTEPTN
jgi:ABC-2 type transport system ATP-binding protein